MYRTGYTDVPDRFIIDSGKEDLLRECLCVSSS